MTNAEEISRRLAAGETFEQIIVAGMPQATRHALRRCACAAGFDKTTYEAILHGSDGPSLATLLRNRSVEPRAGTEAQFRVSSALQPAAWSLWWSEAGLNPGSADVPPELAAFSRRFAEYCRANGHHLEALRALVISDQDTAAELLAEQYEQADEVHDLARCQDLLAILSEPCLAPLVGPKLAALRNDRSRYLKARSMWYGALLASSRYLPRPDIEADLISLLGTDGPRVRRVYASGGMGKTTTLQWLIAHHCVPRRIACALVDLDTLDPINATEHPWLVLLEIAAQLNGQLDGAPFQELLQEHGSYRSVLCAAPQDAARSGANALGGLTVTVDADDVYARVLGALGEDPGTTPVLVVIDTVEEAMLRPAGDPMALLKALRQLIDATPQVRLVISGRQTRAETQLERLPELFPPSLLADLEIPLFREDEARRYLAEVRGIGDPELIEAVIRRTAELPSTAEPAEPGGTGYHLECQPWLLALCADYVVHTPRIRPDDVRQLDPTLAWCIDRVVGRVSSAALQWLLRYAVILRRLRRDVAEHVLLPRITEAIHGSDIDHPGEDLRPAGVTPVFRTGITLPEFDELWLDLLSYTATSSWVRLQPDDLVILHPSVVEPLRRLLARQPVHQLLHADAVSYYEQRAAAAGTAWSEWQREALYHRFRLDGPAAGDSWRAMLARAHEAHDVEAVRELAGEILGPDYLDDDRRPRELAPGRPVLDAGIQARAHLERAWALATAARPAELAGSHQVWSQVELSLAEVDRLIGDAPELVDALPRTRWLTTRAALLIARNRPGEAVELLKPLPSLREITKDTCTALLLCADAQRTLGYPRVAEELLLRAYRLAEELGDTGTTAQIALILADHATERGRYDEATTWARRSAGTPLPPLALATGLPSTAARLAEGSTATQAAALRALGCPSEAVEVCQLALEPPLQPTDPARIRFETGLAAAELLNLDYALWQLLLARKNYFTRQDLEAAACCSAEAAVICLRQAGNLAQAEQYVNEGLRLTLEVGSAGWTRLHLGRVELLHHLGHPERASEECAQVFDVLHATAGHPTLQISAALHGLAFGAADEPRFHDVLHQNLARISPVGARLAALAELALHPGPLDLSAHVPAPLITSANDAIAAPDEFDTAWQTLRMAEVYRLAGQRERAVDRLARGTRVLVKREQTAWWPWLRAMERIGPASPGEFVPPALPGTAPPLLVAAYEVTLAQRRIALDARSVTEARVRRARELLEGMTRITKWHALLEEVATQLAASAGDGDEVQHRRDAARAVYRQLGDELAVADPASEDELAGRELTVHLELDHGRLGIQAGGDPVEIIPECAVLAAALCEKYRSTSTVPVLNHLVKELRSTNRLPAFAHLDPHLPLEGTPPVDVRMTLAPPLLAQVPWELAPAGSGTLATDPRVGVIYRVPNETRAVNVQTMALQRALQRAGFDPGHIDGLAGPLTREAVRAFQRSAGRPADGIAGRHTWAALLARLAALVPARRPRVLILRREADAELSIQRGWHVSGYDLKSLYRRASWDVLSATGADIAERGQWFNGAAADPIDVLHVSTTMDVTQTVPHLSFGVGGPMDDGSSELPQTLAVTVLDRLVQQIATAGTVPLVVLDIAAPPRVSELLRQLLARNDFAHQMVALGHVETVLATAGSPPQLVELLTGGRTAAQIAGELHSAARHATSLEELLIGAGTALVSSIRPAVMVPLPQA